MIIQKLANTYIFRDFSINDYNDLMDECNKDHSSRALANDDYTFVTNKKIRIIVTSVNKLKGLPRLLGLYDARVSVGDNIGKNITLYTLGNDNIKNLLRGKNTNNVINENISYALLAYDNFYKIDGTRYVSFNLKDNMDNPYCSSSLDIYIQDSANGYDNHWLKIIYTKQL